MATVHLRIMATLEFRPPMTLKSRPLAFEFVKEILGPDLRHVRKVCPMQQGAFLHVLGLRGGRGGCVADT